MENIQILKKAWNRHRIIPPFRNNPVNHVPDRQGKINKNNSSSNKKKEYLP